ncbi:hypothetical protein BUALT_Bualt08G0107700 [Buddleja alternifolia]|uniref:Uncharacterized protein n=1 Tax=Buddleja alternifolia TaxID=168488 RepID=A0AAV6X4S1_9LAMI|nr:hypothetical protein BUALT_Bualt08G0107700 [Buddleja alternifolia]
MVSSLISEEAQPVANWKKKASIIKDLEEQMVRNYRLCLYSVKSFTVTPNDPNDLLPFAFEQQYVVFEDDLMKKPFWKRSLDGLVSGVKSAAGCVSAVKNRKKLDQERRENIIRAHRRKQFIGALLAGAYKERQRKRDELEEMTRKVREEVRQAYPDSFNEESWL